MEQSRLTLCYIYQGGLAFRYVRQSLPILNIYYNNKNDDDHDNNNNNKIKNSGNNNSSKNNGCLYSG